jgi:UDP-2,3-diacylglucosamine pyrophosphatase LpxH
MSNHTRYQERINRGLNNAYRIARIGSIDLNDAKLIIFSDHHKGKGDDADDFVPSQAAYSDALRHYFESGHILLVVGDAEELWEDTPAAVLRTYPEILQLENQFYERGRYMRFWGNHDDEWRNKDQVGKHLGKFFQSLSVRESQRLTVFDQGVDLGEIFIVHGHQGQLFADRFGWLSRILIRYFWRPFQRIFKIKKNTPATDWRLRYRHDVAMYNWGASVERLILIAGHTHHPIFPIPERAERLAKEFEAIQELSMDPEEVAAAAADLEFAQAQEKPSYFNTGCCCFSDGRITGIEIVEGEIRLVRWPDEIGRPKPQILDAEDLGKVLQEVKLRAHPMRVLD